MEGVFLEGGSVAPPRLHIGHIPFLSGFMRLVLYCGWAPDFLSAILDMLPVKSCSNGTSLIHIAECFEVAA